MSLGSEFGLLCNFDSPGNHLPSKIPFSADC